MSFLSDAAWLADNWARVVVAVTSTGTLGIAVRFYTVWRKGKTDDSKLEQDGEGALRDHYSAELKALREQIIASGTAHAERALAAEARYRAGLRAADERHDAAMRAADEREAACQAQVKDLRDEVRSLSDEIVQLRRQLLQTGRSALVLATHAPSETVIHAAERADAIATITESGET